MDWKRLDTEVKPLSEPLPRQVVEHQQHLTRLKAVRTDDRHANDFDYGAKVNRRRFQGATGLKGAAAPVLELDGAVLDNKPQPAEGVHAHLQMPQTQTR